MPVRRLAAVVALRAIVDAYWSALGRLRESGVLDDGEFERENASMLDCPRPHNRHRDASE